MKTQLFKTLLLCLTLLPIIGFATEYKINSVSAFEELNLTAGDVVIWEDGTYSSDERITFSGTGTSSSPITLISETPGGVIFDNGLQMDIAGDYLIVDGFYWNGGYGASNFIQFRTGTTYSQNSTIQNCAINGLTAEPGDAAEAAADGSIIKHRWIVLYGNYNNILNCSFMNKNTAGAIVLAEYEYNSVDRCAEVGHTIKNNYFYNFEKMDSSLSNSGDSETIRIGTSEFQNVNSQATVSGNYFVQADGENEIITNKSSNNTYTNNTFRRCRGSLVMRHGANATVDGNFFLGENTEGTGGIRIADSDHTITNNYIQDCVSTVDNVIWNNGLTFVGGNTNSVPDCSSTSVSNAYQDVENITFSNNTFVNTNAPFYFNDSRKGAGSVYGTVSDNVIYFESGNENESNVVSGSYSKIGNTLTFSGNIYDGAELGESVSGFSSASLSASSDGEIFSISGAGSAGASISGSPLDDNDVASTVGACFVDAAGNLLSECNGVVVEEEEEEKTTVEEEEEETTVEETEETTTVCSAETPSNGKTSNVTATSVTFSWSFDALIDHYNVRLRESGSDTWINYFSLRESEDDIEVSGSTASIVISDLASNTTYEWQLRAKCSDGTGSAYDAGAGEDFTTGNGDAFIIDEIEEEEIVTVADLDSSVAPSENLDLSTWNLNVPVEDPSDGDSTNISRADLNDGYELKDVDGRDYFYTAADGGMVFRNYPKDAPKTSPRTSYSRTELRGIFTDNETASASENNWYFSSSDDIPSGAGGVDGVLTATLSVDHVTTDGSSNQKGRVVIGQIHGSNNEPCRLYYHKLPEHTKGAIYVVHERNDKKETWYNLVGNYIEHGDDSGSLNEDIEESEDGVELGEQFSYKIEVIGNDQWVTISRPGKTDITQYINMSDSDYENDYMYFKAGVYSQNKTTDLDEDYDQATFYALSQTHDGVTGAKSLLEISSDEVVIYPSPVVSTTTINGAANSTVNIYDMMGRVVLSQNVVSDSEEIDLSNVSKGVYYAKVNSLEKTSVIKLIKM